jgi:hypothetical protein
VEDLLWLALGSRFHLDTSSGRRKPCHRPTFTHFSTAGGGVVEEQLIEVRPFDLECLGLAIKTALAENKLNALGAVADLKLRSAFPDVAGLLHQREHAHLAKKLAVVWQERLPNVKSGEMLFLEDQHALACAGKKSSCAAPSRATANHYRVVSCQLHR